MIKAHGFKQRNSGGTYVNEHTVRLQNRSPNAINRAHVLQSSSGFSYLNCSLLSLTWLREINLICIFLFVAFSETARFLDQKHTIVLLYNNYLPKQCSRQLTFSLYELVLKSNDQDLPQRAENPHRQTEAK